MANKVYPLYKQDLLAGIANRNLNIDTANDGVFCALVDVPTYTYNDAHQFYSTVAATGAVNSGTTGDQRITAPTVALGTFDGNNLTFISVSGGAPLEALVFYRKVNAQPNTIWPLVLYYDQPGGGLPVTPNGGNILVSFAVAGIFTL
jgi:hypothetical protein